MAAYNYILLSLLTLLLLFCWYLLMKTRLKYSPSQSNGWKFLWQSITILQHTQYLNKNKQNKTITKTWLTFASVFKWKTASWLRTFLQSFIHCLPQHGHREAGGAKRRISYCPGNLIPALYWNTSFFNLKTGLWLPNFSNIKIWIRRSSIE